MSTIFELLQLVSGSSRTKINIIVIILMLIFLLCGLFGYKLFKFIAAVETAALTILLLGITNLNKVVCFIIGIIVGILVFALYEKLLAVITFLLTGLIALAVCGILFDLGTVWSVILAILAASLAAFLVIKFTKFYIIFLTSIEFGSLVGSCLNFLLDEPFDNFEKIAQLVFIVLMAFVQIMKYVVKSKDEAKKSDFSWKESLDKLQDANDNPQITVIEKDQTDNIN